MANTSQPTDPQEPRMPGLDDLPSPQTPVETVPPKKPLIDLPDSTPQPLSARVIRKAPPKTNEEKAEKTDKPAAIAPGVPSTSGVPPTPARPVARPWYRSNRLWSLVAVILCLWGVGTMVPVGKIPFLRNLAYAMGFSPDEANRLSFLKALLSWKDEDRRQRALAAEGNEFSVFNSGGFESLSADASKSKLINVRSVNAALARRGKQGDDLAGSYNAAPGEEDAVNKPGVVLKENAFSADTQANNTQNSEVFFGADSSAVQRGKQDAYNSVNMLKKLNNKPVAGASAQDWLDRLVDKGIREEANLDEVQKSLDATNSVRAQFGDTKKLGDTRAKRDMYYAWLTGRAARRTPQPVLKKTLASAGWDGADMPRSVFSASGFSGVAISSDDVVADVESVKKFMELDEKCRNAIKNGSADAPDLEQEALPRIQALAGSFPSTCGDRANSSFNNTLQALANTCNQVSRSFERVKRECDEIQIDVENKCQAVQLTAYSAAFDAYCNAEMEKCNNLGADATPEDILACRGNANRLSSSNNFADPAYPNITFNSGDLGNVVRNTFFDDQGHFGGDYFPGTDWGNSLWVDPNAGD